MIKHTNKNSENGVATIEFAVTAGFFLLMIVAVVSGSHFYWTHNAIVESTRRGARYAASQCNPLDNLCPDRDTAIDRIRNVVLYGSPTADTEPLVANLQASQITVTYSPRAGVGDSQTFGVGSGTVSVRIRMPPYETTVRGESAGYQANTNLCP
jgi:Flp pilus assembly protein TadG